MLGLTKVINITLIKILIKIFKIINVIYFIINMKSFKTNK